LIGYTCRVESTFPKALEQGQGPEMDGDDMAKWMVDIRGRSGVGTRRGEEKLKSS
jgi:hypothetical protein